MGEGVGACNNYEKKYKYYKEGIVFEDPLDRQNTLVKMAKKRAYVDAMLNVTGASRLFTQDPDGLDDIDEQYTKGNGKNKGSGPGEKKMPFGKNKGTKLKNIDDGYLKWVVKHADKDWLKEAAQAVLDSRNEQSNQNNKDQGKQPDNRKMSKREKEIADLVGDDKELKNEVYNALKFNKEENPDTKTVDDLSDDTYDLLLDTLRKNKNQNDETGNENQESFEFVPEDDFDVPF